TAGSQPAVPPFGVAIPRRALGVLHYAASEGATRPSGARLSRGGLAIPDEPATTEEGPMQQTTVIEELALPLVVAGQPGLPMTAELRYASTDPYAVPATFRADDSEVTWVLSRELLMTGLQAASGIGDV